MEISYNTIESNKQTAEFVQAQWKQHLRLTVPLKNIEWKTFLDSRAKLQYNGAARAGWVGDYMDPYSFLDLFSTEFGDNGTGWSPPEYVEMLHARQQAARPGEALRTAGQRPRPSCSTAQPVIPLYTAGSDWLKKPYVKGMYANPLTLHAWKFVYIEHDPAKWDPMPRRPTDRGPDVDASSLSSAVSSSPCRWSWSSCR